MENQYRNASNLNARIALHGRFSTNGYGWWRWVFDQLELPPNGRILELGCGPANLWLGNLDRLVEGWDITLTDASPGMLREAEVNLGTERRFEFRIADAQKIPFEEHSFDAVIANFVLHLVPDGTRAIAEVARVLTSDGILYTATGGMDHMREMNRMLRILDPAHPDDGLARLIGGFALENGAEQLSSWFSEISLRRYEDSLVVTEARPLVDYLLSTRNARAAADRCSEEGFREQISELNAVLERELASRGAIHITKDTGMFVARR